MEPFIGQIAIFGFSFAPAGWAMCQGQKLPISQNMSLFSIIGTQYGGDGQVLFALPNLQGCAVIGAGQGPGLSPYDEGESGGVATVTLIAPEMASHSHGFAATTDMASKVEPAGNVLASAVRTTDLGAPAPGPPEVAANFYSPNPLTAGATLASIASAGGDQPHNNMQPSLVMNFCIALQGVIPPRS